MLGTAIWPAHTVERNGLRIEVRAQRAVNFALVHNRVPLITEIAIINDSDVVVSGLRISVRLFGADGELADEWARELRTDFAPEMTTTWSDLTDVVPSTGYLKHLNESYPGAIVVTVSQRFRDDIVHRIPVQILAHNEWFNAPVFYDSLAAFVQPNTRAVRTVLDGAAELLEQQTSSASLDAYQQGPERAALIAAAVYESLRNHQIRYISPPASFENTGQKVRTTAQVLDERFGTCIDLAVTYAACIEQTGLRPLIWLVEGHAFTGFMLNEESLKHTSLTEANTMVNLFESHRAIALEANYYQQGDAGSFRAAIEAARRHFANPAKLRAVIDVSTARRDGVRPLPTAAEDIPEVEEQVQPATHTSTGLELPPELIGRAFDDAVLDIRDDSPVRVKKWKRALLDLSTRNRLLNLRSSAQVIDLVVPAQGLAILDNLIHNAKRITLTAHNDLSSIYRLQGARTAQDIEAATLLGILSKDHTTFVAVGEEAYSRRFKRLQRDARTLLEETGASNLFLTFGSLVHKTSTGAEARAPLFLLPVQLIGGTGNSSFQIIIDSANVATPNHCLVEWLRLKHNAVIPELSAPPLDESGIDIEAAFVAIRSGLVANNLDFRVDETAVLAVCQFGTFGMWKDLADSWDVFSRSPLVHHLTFRPGESFIDSSADEIDLDTVAVDETAEPPPIAVDGSQLRAIELSVEGRTFVLEGPPGTGKSQTITNLIARNLVAGRSVLFVAEKQAALDVVKTRLDRIGLSPFTLDLHGRNQSAVEVRNQLRESIEYKADYNQRVWDARIAEYRSKHEPLDEYPERVHSPNSLGDSLWKAYETVVSLGGASDARIGELHAITATPEQSTTIRDAIRLFTRIVRPGDCRPNNPWTLACALSDDDAAVRNALQQLDTAFDDLSANADALDMLTSLNSPDDLSALCERAAREVATSSIESDAWQRFATADWQRYVDNVLDQTSQLQTAWAGLTATFNPVFLARGDYAALIQQATEAVHGFFGRKKREEQFARSLAAVVLPGVQLTAGDAIPLLSSVPSARDHSAHIAEQMRHVFGALAPQLWDPLSVDAVAELRPTIEYIRESLGFARRRPLQWNLLRSRSRVDQSFIDVLRGVHAAWTSWAQVLGATEDSVSRWRSDATWLEAWARDRAAWNADVGEYGPDLPRRISRAAEALTSLRQPGLENFVSQLLDGSIPASEAEFGYFTGAAQASLNERLKTQHLDTFDPLVRSGQTSDFAEVADVVRREQKSALPARIIQHRGFRAGELKGKVGELRRQLDLRRKGKSVRRLMEEYGAEIIDATPCFFVSPASLAQFVPPGALTFDLVVFDEASQITVAQAIGALGRGRAAIVVGDSQQMPPTAFGQVITNVDDEDEESEGEVVPEDLDSILTECVESSLPRIWLSWHYRSRDESLIAFSNKKYYDKKLASLPAPGGQTTTGLELRRVHGHFNREDKKNEFRTNRVEAEAIVLEVHSMVNSMDGDKRSVGVVTFNRQQQELVLDLLEATGDQRILHLLKPDTENGIFVKNLENVQGDERDVILFSTAFSKRPGEQNMPLNFGPLTRFGGQKRLNVAVTRARSKVIVFTSFDPSDIDLSRTKSTGMEHLKAYLEAAAAGSADLAAASVPDRYQPNAIQSAIAEELRRQGFEVELDYGLSEFVVDIAVRDPQSAHWQVAVMLDGPRWASRPTVADRELTPGLLESMMGWFACERVWLPEWIKDRQSAVDRIADAIEKANAADAESRAAAAATQSEEALAPSAEDSEELDEIPALAESTTERDERDGAAVSAAESGIEPVSAQAATRVATAVASTRAQAGQGNPVSYVAAPTTPIGSRDELDHPNWQSVRARIQDAVRESIEIEGPIALNRLVRNVVHRFGFDKAMAKRQEVVFELIPADLIHDDEFGSFVWPTGLIRGEWTGFRTTPLGFFRPLYEIAGEEIINALVHAAYNGVHDQEQLMRKTLAYFDQTKLTKQAADRLERCIAMAERSGRLIRRGAGYIAAM